MTPDPTPTPTETPTPTRAVAELPLPSGERAGVRGAATSPRRWFPWLVPAALYAGLIFWLSHQPNPFPWAPQELWSFDKLAHAAEYAVFSGLLTWGLWHSTRLGPRRAALVAVLVAAVYGVSDEFHQSFVPNRAADPRDWAADAAGALVGGLVAAVALRRRRTAG